MLLDDTSELSRGSDKKVSVVCDSRESKSCLGNVMRRYRDVQSNIDRNNGKYMCQPCSRFIKRSGRNNPSCKYKELDDYLMDVIDSEAKAYLLGWIASDGWLHGNGIIGIGVNICDVGVLEILRDFICPDLPIVDCKGSMKKLHIYSTQWYKSIQGHLNLSFNSSWDSSKGKGESHKKSHLVQMPVDISDSLKWSFLRGLFEGDGSVFITKDPRCWANGLGVNISSSSPSSSCPSPAEDASEMNISKKC